MLIFHNEQKTYLRAALLQSFPYRTASPEEGARKSAGAADIMEKYE